MANKKDTIANIMDNLRRVFQILNEQSQRIKHETGLTGPQLWAVRVIHEHGPINISDIAKRMYLHPTTVLGIVDRLESRGLVIRHRSQEDRRIIWLELTPQGSALVRSVPEVVQGVLSPRLAAVALTDLAKIDAGIGLLVESYGIQALPPKPILAAEMVQPREKKNADKGEGPKKP